jgi:hypothetical protein
MKITITRSFERTRQIADFVPIKAYCEATIEEDDLPNMDKLDDEGKKELIALQREMSEALDLLVRQEVEKTLMSYYPLCIVCGARGQTVNLNKEGVCGNCVTSREHQARDFKRNIQDKSQGRKSNQQTYGL